jgi:hypothetical protein
MTIDSNLCYEALTRPLFLWNDPRTFFFINYETKFQNIIFDGSNLISIDNPCNDVNIGYCCLNYEGDLTEACLNILKAQKIDLCETTGEGMFNFEYWPDFKWTVAPLLTIEVIDKESYINSRACVQPTQLRFKLGFSPPWE